MFIIYKYLDPFTAIQCKSFQIHNLYSTNVCIRKKKMLLFAHPSSSKKKKTKTMKNDKAHYYYYVKCNVCIGSMHWLIFTWCKYSSCCMKEWGLRIADGTHDKLPRIRISIYCLCKHSLRAESSLSCTTKCFSCSFFRLVKFDIHWTNFG